MTQSHHLVFEAGMIRSLRYPKRFGNAQTIISTGRWPDGASISGSDAAVIAAYLKPSTKRWKVTRHWDAA